MAIEGWYYLHTNGSLIYKMELGSTAVDLRESSFAIMLWPLDPQDRLTAWLLLIEATSLGVDPDRVNGLAEKWGCDDLDAQNLIHQMDVKLFMDGDKWCATCKDFVNLQESPVGFGETALAAMAELCSRLGYKPTKTWGKTFKDLLTVRAKTTVVNLRHEPYDVYIGRGSQWGNPFRIGQDGTRDQVIEKFRELFLSQPVLVALAKRVLKGKRLGCYCKPEACHGDVLVEIVEGES